MPSSSCLLRKIHFVPMILCFVESGLSTRDQTLFLSNWLSSSSMAVIQSESLMASSNFDGSSMDTNEKFPQKLANRVRERVVGRPGKRISFRIESTSTLLRTRGKTPSYSCGYGCSLGSA